jgi:hypothetical protein
MAAIDPSEIVELEDASARPRATLKIIREPIGSEEDDEYMRGLIGDSDDSDSESDESEEEESDDEANGGPSDPAKSKKAKKAAALKELMESLGAESDSDEDMEEAGINGTNGLSAVKKGKGKATEDDEEDSEDDDSEDLELEQFVLCTLDPEKVSDRHPNSTDQRLHLRRIINKLLTLPLPKTRTSSSKFPERTRFTSPATMLFLTMMDTTTTMRSMIPSLTPSLIPMTRKSTCLLMRMKSH